MTSKFGAQLKKELLELLIQSGTYIASFIFLFGFSCHYFIFNGFFTYNQSVDLDNYFASFPFLMIAFIPSLTFNAFKNDDTFSNLALTDSLKFLAKFLAAFIIFAFNTLVTMTTLPFIARFGDLEASQILTGYIGILFYGAMLLSFSLFIQILFENKIASLVVLIVSLFAFNSIHVLPKYHAISSEFFINLIKTLSFSWHFESALKGILNTKDLLFFLILTFAFLFLAVEIYKAKKGKKFWSLQNSLVLVLIILAIANSAVFEKKIDLTKNKEFTLSKLSVTTAKDCFSSVNITYAYSKELKNLNPQVNDIIDLLFKYSDENPSINIFIQNPEKDKNLQKKLKDLGISAQNFSNSNHYESGLNSYYSAIIIEDENYVKTIPFVLSTNGLEYLITANLFSIQSGKEARAIVFCRNNLTLENGYPYLVPYLESCGLSVFTELKIEDLELTDPAIPVLILGGSTLTQDELHLIQERMEEGRKFFFCTSPYTIDVEGDWKVLDSQNALCKLLENEGISLSRDFVLDENCFEMTMQSQNFESEYQKIKYPFWVKDGNLTFYWPVAIQLDKNGRNEDKYEILAQTSEEGYLKSVYDDELKIDTNPFSKDNLVKDISTMGKHALAVKKDNIRIIADQYFPSFLMSYTGSLENINYMADSLIEMNGFENLLELKNKKARDTSFTKIKSTEELNSCRMVTQLFTVLFIPIFTVLLSLTIVLSIRNFKKKGKAK
ncbi:MAG: Gldg family protein [Treponemataceae bacterium]|nr:Gldg family protein [Treponemataceae bacterium]